MTRVEILTHNAAGFAGMHAAGFALYRGALRRQLGVESSLSVYGSHDDLRARLCAGGGDPPADVAVVISDWSAPVDRLREIFATARAAHPARSLVYFDIFDQTSSPYLGLLPEVDVYLKAKMLAPFGRYQEAFEGGYVFTDFCRRTLGWDLEGWHFGSVPDPALASKIVRGWNFAPGRRCRTLLRINRLLPSGYRARPIELHARITPPARAENEWYEQYRGVAVAAVEPLRARLRVTPVNRLSQFDYFRELRRCKLVFSPFGWGEVCLRDYEAVCSGCVLVKPDMAHVSTSPDIFVAGETYAPVRWDLSDLGEVCERYLKDEAAAERMARNAQDRLHGYFECGGFVEDVRGLLVRLGRG